MELFANESAALNQELRALNFDSIDESQKVVRFHTRSRSGNAQKVIVVELIGLNLKSTETLGEYSYDIQLLDLDKRSELYRLKDELLLRMTKNLETRKAAGEVK